MTLYYTLVFLILLAEMVSFGALVLTPRRIRITLLRTLTTFGPILERVLLALKFTFVFILVLFVDAVNRVYRSQADFERFRGASGAAQQAIYADSDIQARRFYAQRNMYLCGFTLFLTLVLNRTYILVVKLTNAEEELKKSGSKDDSKQVAELKKELEKKDQDLATVKKQADNLAKEYDRISDQLNAKEGNVSGDKKND